MIHRLRYRPHKSIAKKAPPRSNPIVHPTARSILCYILIARSSALNRSTFTHRECVLAQAIHCFGELPFHYGETLMLALLVRCFKDEQGNEVLEYAILMGLIVLVALALIGTVGTKCAKMWNSIATMI
jgi:Flp pilus assembly pilin Flp